MSPIRSSILGFFLGALTMAIVGLGVALHLTGWFAALRPSEAVLLPVIRIRTNADAEAIRRELTEFLFGSPQLPTTLPEAADGGMLVRLPNGFTSFIAVSVPPHPNGALVLYHTGHEGYTARDRAAIRAFLEAGYTVWRLNLPLIGQQTSGVVVDLPSYGKLTIREHRQMAYLDEVTEGHPLRYFVEPVVAAVNQAEAAGFTDIFVVGLSGGGWVTILAAAVDPRVDGSYPIAGGLPLAFRFEQPRRNWGDWEENLPELFRIASFEDLSILGAAGRSQIQVLNEYDLCCYNDPRYLEFVPAIQAVVESLGGHFSVYWARGEFLHRANPAALQVILSDISRRRTP
ncbi:MAG: PhoPQ-activated protein PqaA family protein [Anaerolineae bacterium]|nr:PhoPQ-activated protein PqaA family protein [Anaerolineae bacterium]MCX8068291.1 PhoPQ-activated protein PqaA family protein [Anaerolineae bacterium]MDW7992034.1 PhoPQ-activated protein PqaA family protein [Anaerolineae bacterium]